MVNEATPDDWLNGENEVIEIEMTDNDTHNDDAIILILFIILLHIAHQNQSNN